MKNEIVTKNGLKAHSDCRIRPTLAPRLKLDANIMQGHPAERGNWIWSPEKGRNEPAFLRFKLQFESASEKLNIHVTADNRFQLAIDGVPIAYGPDRGSPEAWPVTSLCLSIGEGLHELTALCWYLPSDSGTVALAKNGESYRSVAPMSQMSWHPGFLLVADNQEWRERLDTGVAPWILEDITDAVQFRRPVRLGYHDIGPAFDIDCARWCSPISTHIPHTVVRSLVENRYGVRKPGWILCDSELPEQKREKFCGGTIRSIRSGGTDTNPWSESFKGAYQPSEIQRLLGGDGQLVVPPGESVDILWDFAEYVCGYPSISWSGGAGARISIEWAESLFEMTVDGSVSDSPLKGCRAEIEGKLWHGFGDSFVASGADEEVSPGIWWRSGRYLRIRVIGGTEKPLHLRGFSVLRTGYPFVHASEWSSSDVSWDRVYPFLAKGLSQCAHETWVDCPYYEQLNYVGDTRLHHLSNYVAFADTRLSRRSLMLFEASRATGGIVAERFPSAWRQESGTYAMIYGLMVEDYLLWCGEGEWIAREILPGLRQMWEEVLRWRDAQGCMGRVPGWPCVDWVTGHGWKSCSPPGTKEGDSSVVNLHFVLFGLALARIERWIGEEAWASRCESQAHRAFEETLERYWSYERNLLLDNRSSTEASEHAQALAILTGLLTEDKKEGCRNALLGLSGDLARCTIYFSFYLLEALKVLREPVPFFEALTFWKTLPEQGFVSLPEAPEPSRSDCHGWGAHPLFHTHASIAGVRPLAPGSEVIEIQPMPGLLEQFSCRMVHPKGFVLTEFRREGETEHYHISVPEGVRVHFSYRGLVEDWCGGIRNFSFC